MEMEIEGIPLWLKWAREIEAIGQTGMHFSRDVFDRTRYRRLVGIASEILAQYTSIPGEQIERTYLSQDGYATPKVDVRAVVFMANKILMVQERLDKCWSIPGGYADVNEQPSAMVEREALEESGFIVKAHKLVGVYESNHDRVPLTVFHAYKLVFLCEIVGGEGQPGDETLAVDFFDLDNLPPLSTSRVTQRVIEEAFAHSHDPLRAAAFD
jgi:ADP-ribose pyrophosphatase YjhB (NUDIX family)